MSTLSSEGERGANTVLVIYFYFSFSNVSILYLSVHIYSVQFISQFIKFTFYHLILIFQLYFNE